MTEYALYLESGPRRRKTMVHVLDLLGCIARGSTTGAALEATPEAIRAYLRFLQRHGEAVEPEGIFTTVVAEHIMEGPWLGNGNPASGFGPDFKPLAARELNAFLRRLAWLHADLVQLVRDVPQERLVAEPEDTGRSIYRILEHIAECQGVYLQSALGKVDSLPEALRAVKQGPEALPLALTHVWQIANARLEGMTEEELEQRVSRGQVTWTARRALRRMLEHEWEHLMEIAERLGKPSPLSIPSVGIVSAGMYLPEPVLTAADIAEQSGLPEWVVRDKLGINQKRMAGPDDHPNQMAIWAAQDCLSKCDIPPEEIDVVLCTTEEWKEYIQWTAGIDLAYEIGATRAWGIDLHMRCCTTISALKMAKDMMIADPDVNTVLIAGGYSTGDLVNLKNPRTSFMFNIGAGAGALLLRKNWPRNHVLGAHLMTDGSMSKHILVPASGTVQFPTDAAVAKGLFYVDLLEPEAMKERLNAVSMDNWMHCIDEALRKSKGDHADRPYRRDDLAFLNMIHIKPSAYRDMLQHLGLTEEQSVYNADYGRIGEQDSIINIIEGVKQGRLKDGDLMIIVGAGVGYVWGAACAQWGERETQMEQK